MSMAHKTLLSIGSILIAEATPVIDHVAELHIPPVVMEAFQCVAWLSGAVIALVTILKYLRDASKNSNNKE